MQGISCKGQEMQVAKCLKLDAFLASPRMVRGNDRDELVRKQGGNLELPLANRTRGDRNVDCSALQLHQRLRGGRGYQRQFHLWPLASECDGEPAKPWIRGIAFRGEPHHSHGVADPDAVRLL